MQLLRAICITAILASSQASAGSKSPSGDWVVGSVWRITVNDGPDKPRQSVTVRVQAEEANSCMGGSWKRLKRVSGSYEGLSEPAYIVSGQRLTILLASDVCDRYDRLEGTVENGRFSGSHSLFGIRGSDELGSAIAVRVN